MCLTTTRQWSILDFLIVGSADVLKVFKIKTFFSYSKTIKIKEEKNKIQAKTSVQAYTLVRSRNFRLTLASLCHCLTLWPRTNISLPEG